MKNRRLLFLLVFVILVALGTVVCIMVLNVPREEYLTTIELPSGDRIIIEYDYDDFLSALFPQSGGLKYDVYSGESHTSGQLTRARKYDMLQDVKLIHEIQGERRVKIEEGRYRRSWIFEGDSSGRYEVIELDKQQQGIQGD